MTDEHRDRMPDFEPPSDDELAREASAAPVGSHAVPVPGARWSEPEVGPQTEAGRDGIRPPEPRSRVRRVLDRARHPAVAFVAGLAVATVVLAGVPAISRAIETGTLAELERVIDEYVAAVEAGDVERAAALQPLDPDEADVSLIEAGGAPATPPSYDCADPRIFDDGDRATVVCEATLPQFGSGLTSTIELRRDGSWGIVDGLIRPSVVSVSFGTVTSVGGVEIDGRGDVDDPVWLLPGEYETTYTTFEGFAVQDQQAGPDEPTLTAFDGWASVNAWIVPTAETQQRFDDAAVAYVASCAEAEVAGCPTVGALESGQSWEAELDESGGYSIDETSMTQPMLVRRVGSSETHRVSVRAELGDEGGIVDIQVSRS